MKTLTFALGLLVLGAVGCGGGSAGAGDDDDVGSDAQVAGGDGAVAQGDGGSGADDFVMQASDFECVTRWQKVRRFRITNKLGHTAEAVALATANTGGDYPVGTLIQLVPFEAMIKRKAGFSATSRDWEFFSLSVSANGTTIRSRGSDGVVNQFGGNCLSCHNKAEPRWDLICESGHGCDALPLSAAQIDSLQNNDARCP